MKRSAILFLLLISPLAAFTPKLNLIEPRGGQRGTEMEVRFHGERLTEISGALFYQAGLGLSDFAIKDDKHLVAKLSILPDAPLGEHSIRLHGPGGITELRSFWVGQFPSITEIEPNATFDQAQRVELNQTIHGIAENEDDDYYVCTLKKGQRLSVEIEAMRLGRVLFDSYIAILDPKRFELAACDDSPLLRTDSFVSIIAPEDGDYRILVHEASYQGNPECQYRLHIGTFPRPKAVFPIGAKPGETREFTFIGDPSGPIRQTLTIPNETSSNYPIFPIHDGLSAPSPQWITVSPLNYVDKSGEHSSVESALAMPPLPSAAHGILEGKQPSDWYRFQAKKGQNLVLVVHARRLRSPLDSVLSVHDSKGKQLALNDDQGSPDSIITWACPADGDYALQIRDQLGRSGPDFTYRIEITEKSPSLAASLPVVERTMSQKWKTFPIPRGNRYAAVVNVTRENIACDAAFEAASLPPGVTMHSPAVARTIQNFPIVFEAAPDAPLSAGLHGFSIRSTGDSPALTGKLIDTIHHVEVNNEGTYHSVRLDQIATAVTHEAPFRIDLETPIVPLVQNGTLPLRIRVTRTAGYAEKISVRFLWSPPGVSGPVTIDVPGDQSEATYELNANADAPAAEWQICVLAEADTPQGPVLVSSALTPLKVMEPFIQITLDLAATEQGKATALLGKIEHRQAFEGSATIELAGLPHGAASPPVTFIKDQTEIQFPITIAADAKVGKHTAIFCRVSVPLNGGTVLHQTAMNSTLRIDSPPPATAQNPTRTEAPPKTDPSAKPLSRLEQLRQRGK
jgi:hypothetical protein